MRVKRFDWFWAWFALLVILAVISLARALGLVW